VAPAGSWIVYRPSYDPRLVYLSIVDERRPGIVNRIRVIDMDSWELVREEDPQQDERGGDRPRQERPRDRDERPREQPANPPPPVVQPPGNRPDEPKPPESRPPDQRPLPPPEIIRPVQPPPPTQPPADQRPPENKPPEQRPPDNKPPEPPPAPVGNLTLNIPPGHLPEIGECRLWIPLRPPGLQPKPKSRTCEGIAAVAPAASWIIYRPRDDQKVVHVRVIDEHRAGVVVRVRIFDIASKRLVREENP